MKAAPHLISEESFPLAQYKARGMGLAPYQWVFIPLDEPDRILLLAGRIGYTDEKLIGPFTEFELAKLKRPA